MHVLRQPNVEKLQKRLVDGTINRREFNRGLAAVGLSLVTYPIIKGPARAAGELVVVTWPGYDVPELMGDFIAKYGRAPDYSYFGSEDEVFSKVHAGYAPDLLHPGNYIVRKFVDADLLQPIDTDRLKVWPDIAPEIRDVAGAIHNGKRYFIPAEFGHTSVLFRTDLVDPKYVEENTLEIVFDERYAGRIAWTDDSGANIRVAALVLGYENIWDLNDDQLEEVRKLLTKQRKLVRFYWSDPTEMEQSMASGEVVMAWGYNQSLVSLKRQGLPVAFMTPKEGLFAWGSGFIMHKDVEDEQAAYDYIDAWIAPESGAWLIDNYGYASSNLKAYGLVASERLDELGFSNPEEVIRKTIFFQALEPEVDAKYEAIYTEVRAEG